MNSPCFHKAQCPFKDQPSQCPHAQKIGETQANADALEPTPETLWTNILEETIPNLPSW